jgi:hypothetical protein
MSDFNNIFLASRPFRFLCDIPRGLLLLICILTGCTQAWAQQLTYNCHIFPPNNIWNTPVDTLPIDLNSSVYIASIGNDTPLHPDFGPRSIKRVALYWLKFFRGYDGTNGIPYSIASALTKKVAITFEYKDESDPGPYPIPQDVAIEGGTQAPEDSDRHVIVIDDETCTLYELWKASPQQDGTWKAGGGAIFNLKSNKLRTEKWSSTDAAGLPIFPGLVRYDEVKSYEIAHALRFTVKHTRRAYVWPARHYASKLTDTQFPPMGQRFRLKANFDISSFSPDIKVILRALKKYGMMLADNGGDLFLSGAPDDRWSVGDLQQLKRLKASDFEAVDVSSLILNVNSAEAKTK